MRVWDIRRAAQVLRQQVGDKVRLHLVGSGKSAWLAAAAAVVLDSDIESARLTNLSDDRDQRPVFLNADRSFTPSELLALAVHRTDVVTFGAADGLIKSVAKLARNAHWGGGDLTVK